MGVYRSLFPVNEFGGNENPRRNPSTRDLATLNCGVYQREADSKNRCGFFYCIISPHLFSPPFISSLGIQRQNNTIYFPKSYIKQLEQHLMSRTLYQRIKISVQATDSVHHFVSIIRS